MKTILQFAIYVILHLWFLHWYKALVIESKKANGSFDLEPFFRYLLYSAIFNILFFLVLSLRKSFPMGQFSFLTARSFALALIFHIVVAAVLNISIDEYLLFTIAITTMTALVLIKEGLLFSLTNKRSPKTEASQNGS